MRLIVLFFLFFNSSYCFADLAVDRTRIIINDENPFTSFNIRNIGVTPVILQGWISGYSQENKENSVDMVMIPPIFKLMPGEIKSVRINSFVLPDENKEEIYFLNVQQIPIAVHDNIHNKISLSVRLRLKLFLRSPKFSYVKMSERIKMLNCRVNDIQKSNSFTCLNSSGFFFTVNSLQTPSDVDTDDIPDGLIPPFSKRTFELSEKIPQQTNIILIDDNGDPFLFPLKK